MLQMVGDGKKFQRGREKFQRERDGGLVGHLRSQDLERAKRIRGKSSLVRGDRKLLGSCRSEKPPLPRFRPTAIDLDAAQ